MIRTLVKPDKQNISIKLPKDFIGKQVEVIVFTVEEANNTPGTAEGLSANNRRPSDEDSTWQNLAEPEFNMMSLSYAEKSFAANWDINNQAENDYWNSF
jgi:hypothetical protein